MMRPGEREELEAAIRDRDEQLASVYAEIKASTSCCATHTTRSAGVTSNSPTPTTTSVDAMS